MSTITQAFKKIVENYRVYRRKKRGSLKPFDLDPNIDVASDILKKYNYDGPLLKIYANNKNNLIHKWHHYIPLYDHYFSKFRGTPVKFLEIGVSEGGSLQMWREYFGAEAKIFGVDINPGCKKFDGIAGQVRIGSQTDANFLKSVIDEMGGVDVILDDGSHHMDHIAISLRTLFPILQNGGLYMIEDLHCSYWYRFGGGYHSKNNFFNRVRDIVDDMHGWYHTKKPKESAVSENCSAIHIHDSIVVFEKNKVYKPVHSRVV